MAVYTHTTNPQSIFQIQTPTFAVESGSFSYNQDSGLYLTVIDYGDILDGINEEIDSGNVFEPISYIEDYGEVLIDTEPAFGELDTLDASTLIKFALGHIGGGIAFALQGGTFASFGNAYIGYDGNIFDIEGENTLSLTYIHEGSGNLSGIIGAAERVTSSFNVSSVALFLREDYNLISESVEEEEDYGYISSNILNAFEDYNTIAIGSQDNPYGLFRFVGDASKSVNFILTANPEGGSILALGNANVSITPVIPPGSGKFEISGGLSKESFTPSTEIGSGTISNFVSKEERATFSYNQSSQNFLTDEDFGFISESSPTISSYANTQISTLANEIVSTFTVAGNIEADDFGIISEFVNRPDSEDFGRITDKDDKPFGTFRFEGDASKTVTFILTANPEGGSLFGFGGGAETVAPFIPVEYGLLNLFGAATEAITPAPHVGSGSLFNFISKEERRTFSYNGSSIVDQDNVDFGFISEAHVDQDDFGIISEFVNRPDSEDFGFISTVQNRPYGSLRFEGDNAKTTRFRLRYPGSGRLFAASGAAALFGIKEEAKVLFRFTGDSTQSASLGHVGSGSLFTFITKEERKTYSYNGSSVTGDRIDDYRLINETAVEFEDYGTVTDFPDSGIYNTISYPQEDYGLINIPIDDTRRPFGRFRFAGNASESSIPTTYIGSGSLFTFIGSSESITQDIPPGQVLFNFAGTATERITPAPHVGSGSLFNFISKEERRTYSYNTSSQVIVEVEDFGFISDSSPQIATYASTPISDLADEIVSTFGVAGNIEADDFGIISEFVNRPDSEDYGLVITIQKRPFGLFSINGTAIEKNTEDYVGSGSLFNFISATESADVILPVSGLFSINGTAIEKNTEDYVGSGSLFTFITKEERKTYSYNGSSVTGDRIDDYRLINETAVEFEDYGSVTDFPDSGIYDTISYHQEDYGLIDIPIDDTRRPFGRFRFAGTADESITPTTYIGSGSLFTFIGSSESITQDIPPGQVLFNFAGAATEAITPAPEVGSGSLFNFISKEERRTFSYNGSSIVTREDIDFGSVSEAHVDQDDFGIISEFVNRTDSEDFGFISTIIGRPYGSLRFTGDASKETKFSLKLIVGGSLFALGGGNESITPFIPARFGLFTVAGAVTQSFTPAPEIGTGTLFNFVTKEERRTYSYNGSSVVTQEDIDYGFIRDIAVTSSPSISTYASTPISDLADEIVSTFGVIGDYADYGSIGELVNAPGSADYGFLDSVDKRPFGRFRFSGLCEETYTPSYLGSGSLFALGGSGEVISRAEDAKVLFTFAGGATLASTPSPEIGSGVLFTFVSADESKTFRHISDDSTGLRISGEVSLTSTADEVGTGRLFAATGAAETFGANPFIPPALFKFKSGSTESFTPASHVVTGVVSPRRSSAIFDPEEKIRLVGATESTTNSPDVPASGFKIFAPPIRIFFQYREQGGGKLTLAGNARIRLNPRHIGSGKFNINGIGTEATVPFIPPGSGSLFSFVNGDESTTPATHIGQGKLFSLRGQALTQFPRGFTGGGQIRVNVETGIIVIWDYPVNLTIPVRGESDNTIAYDYDGSGKFTISDESKNYFANRFFSFSGGFSILGQARAIAPVSHVGSGTLFAFDSSAENTGANPPDRTLPIRLVGTANESKTEIFNGSGSIISGEKRSEKVLRYKDLSSPKISQYANTPISDLSDEVISEFLQQGLLEEYALVSANESFVSVPPTKDSAITIEGSRENETQSSDYVGSGSLFSFDSAAESTLYSPIGEITLFEFEGSANESNTFSYSETTQGLFGKDTNLPKPFGAQFIFGSASVVSTSAETAKDRVFKFNGGISSETFTPTEESKGSLFGLNSSTESVLYSPIGEITLFEFEGNSDEKISLVTIGSGSLFGFVNGAESSLVEPPIETLLLNITGSATERIAPGPHSGSGTIFSFIGSAESTTSAEDKKVLFKINVDSSENRTSTFEGLGKITSLGSSTKVIVFKYPPTEGILQIFGNKIESFGKANYDGECRTQFIGISSNKTVEFEPPKPIRLYLI